MEITEEDTGSQLKDIQIGCSWIPTTPAKPDLTKQQPICTNWQENYTPANLVAQANLSESGRLPGDFQQVTQSQTIPACYSSTNLINVGSGSNNWRADEAKKSHVSGDNLSMFDTWHEVEVLNPYVYGEDLGADDKYPKLGNMSFQNLLALAHAGSNGAAVDTELTHTDFVAARSTSVPHFHPQIGSCQLTMSFGNSPLQDLDSSPGAKFDAELNIQNVSMDPTDRSSIPSRPIFDLNSSPRTITDAASSKSTSSFEHITPAKTNKAEHRQDSGTKELSIDEIPAKRHTKENQITEDGVLELHETKEKSHLVIDQLCAAASTQLQENHKPDKGGTEEVLFIKTPQQKPRRKKHRPKVIIEGQQNSTSKSSVGKHTVPQETTRVKRRYVRRKGVNNPLGGDTNGTDSNNNTPSSMDTPVRKRRYVRRKETDDSEGNMDKGTTETTDIKSPSRTRSSCRRSLNFNSVGQAGDECSSYCPSSNCNKELQAENSNEKDQARILRNKEGMEVMTGKNDTGISHELTHSTNQAAGLQASQQHTRNMDQLKDDHNMFTDQITHIRGKCQIIFSDVTHDKEANIVQVRMNSDCQRTPKSQTGSTCSSTCLTQVRGLKRQNMSTSVDEELPDRNDIGAFYNSLQGYLPIFSRNADKNDTTPGFHFPVIYKKKRTEKGHNMVTPSSQYTESTSDNHVKHALRDSCSKLFIATTSQGSPGIQGQVSNLLSTNCTADGMQNGRQVFEDLLALGPTEKIKKRRSKGNTRLRDLASLLEICKELPGFPSRAATSRIKQNAEILHEPHNCMEALVADTRSTMTTKKRSRRSPLSNSMVQNMYNQRKSATISIGKPLALTWKSMSPIDSLIEQLDQLDLNAESSHALAQNQNAFISFHTQYQEQALVPFQRCGDVIPFDNSFAQVRRRKPRPKVDLDDETTRVWKLLLENINSEGIDGTDEEKTKWWEEERRVFSGRADSFIARMRMVQGISTVIKLSYNACNYIDLALAILCPHES